MALIEIRDFGFAYPDLTEQILSGISLDIEKGSFVLLCGRSGSGKTTLLRSMKPELAPAGTREGTLRLFEKDSLSPLESAEQIGFVMQDPDNQIVMDSVWLELAFGMENLGLPPEEIGRRIGEIAGFFGIQSWFGKSVFELSGGQKQILNLASVIAMQAEIIVLDEPTSQLDPIAAKEFLQMLRRVNTELGKTVILSEHRFEDVLSLCDEVLFLDEGGLRYHGGSRDFAFWLNREDPGFALALPGPARLALRYARGCVGVGAAAEDGAEAEAEIGAEAKAAAAAKAGAGTMGAGAGMPEAADCPLDVREGRRWLTDAMRERRFFAAAPGSGQGSSPATAGESPVKAKPVPILAAKDIWYRYEKEDGFILKGLHAEILEGMMHAFVGGNGSGKSTLMKLLAGVYRPLKGKIQTAKGAKVRLLPQDPKSVFVCDSLAEDLREHIAHLSGNELDERVEGIARRLGLSHLMQRHPYDLSGGEMQKAALAKVLLLDPDVLLLDEPSKGIDAFSKAELAKIFRELLAEGKTIAMVTHDIEFAAEQAHRCSMLFGSAIIAEGEGRSFFGKNMFYTTSINRMTRGTLEGCILEGDIAWE